MECVKYIIVEEFVFIMLKKIFALTLAAILLFSITACKNEEEVEEVNTEETTITWWSLPVFSQPDSGEESFEQSLMSAFTKLHPEITIEHKILSADTYADEFDTAIRNRQLPDVYFGYPEQTIELAENGKMVDLKDVLFKSQAPSTEENTDSSSDEDQSTEDVAGVKPNIPDNILKAATTDNGTTYTFFPIAASAEVMAFNKEVLEQAGALDLLPTDGDRSWTVDQYKELLVKLKEGLAETDIDTGALYYGSTKGIDGSKNLIASAGGTMFEQDGELLIASENGVAGLTAIKDIVDEELLINGMSMQSSTNLEAFLNGEIAHTILYSMDTDLNHKSEKKDNFTTIFMPYPSTESSSLANYTLLGATVYDSADDAKIEAAKLFVDFLANSEEFRSSVSGRTGGYSVNKDYNDFLEGEYAFFGESLDLHGPYTFLEFDTEEINFAWLKCLNQIFYVGSDIAEELDAYATSAKDGGIDISDVDNSEEVDSDDTDDENAENE